MTSDDIIRMADAAGSPGWDDHEPLTQDMLHSFAALVAAAEREACAKICDNLRLPDQPLHNYAVIMCRNEIKARGRT